LYNSLLKSGKLSEIKHNTNLFSEFSDYDKQYKKLKTLGLKSYYEYDIPKNWDGFMKEVYILKSMFNRIKNEKAKLLLVILLSRRARTKFIDIGVIFAHWYIKQQRRMIRFGKAVTLTAEKCWTERSAVTTGYSRRRGKRNESFDTGAIQCGKNSL